MDWLTLKERVMGLLADYGVSDTEINEILDNISDYGDTRYETGLWDGREQ